MALVNNAENAIYAKDPDGRYLQVNDKFCSLFRPPRHSILGRIASEISQGPEAERRLADERLVMERKAALSYPDSVELPDGRHELLSVKFPILDAAGRATAIGGIDTDVTALRKAEISLRESEEKFRAAFHSIPICARRSPRPSGATGTG